MNKIECFILECGDCLEEMVAFNTVTISIFSKESRLDDNAKENCLKTLESKLGQYNYESGDESSAYVMYAFSSCVVFSSGKELFHAANDFREIVKSLLDGQYDIEITLSNTGENEEW